MQRFFLSCAVVALGCEGNDARVYTAQAYQTPDPTQPGCLEGYVPVAIVYADRLPADCEPVCLRLNRALYVSSVCAPYPEQAQLESAEDSADCAAALAALAEAQTCDALLPGGPADAAGATRDQ
jgi:hypothetical protein